jgi:hypothetical protein
VWTSFVVPCCRTCARLNDFIDRHDDAITVAAVGVLQSSDTGDEARDETAVAKWGDWGVSTERWRWCPEERGGDGKDI